MSSVAGTTALQQRRPGYSAKLQRQIITPEGVPLNISIAAASARAGALILDIVIIFGLMLAYLLGILFFVNIFDISNTSNAGFWGQLFLIVTILFVFLLRNAYFLYFELGDRSATWGKRAVGIRVASRDGGRLTADAIIARNLVRDIELFLPLIFMVSSGAQGQMSGTTTLFGFAWVAVFLFFPLFNKDRLRCGDLIAGTWVIEAPKAELTSVVTPSDSMIFQNEEAKAHYQFTNEELSVYGEYELQTLESVLRNGSDDALVSVCNAICRKIGWNPGSGEERVFLEAYYAQLRAKLESDMRFGKRRADKHSEAE